MPRPPVSWLPLRRLHSLISAGCPSLDEWFTLAYSMGLSRIDLHAKMLPSTVPEALRAIRARLHEHGLAVATLHSSPDIVHPESDARAAQNRVGLDALAAARHLACDHVSFTPGLAHPDSAFGDALTWCAESLAHFAEAAGRMGVAASVQNAYRDPVTHQQAFAATGDEFAEVLTLTASGALGVTLNVGAPFATAGDPLALLELAGSRLRGILVEDRFPGQSSQMVLSGGGVDFDSVFQHLAAAGYDSPIAFADCNPAGDAGTRQSLGFLREKIAQWWR